MKFEPQQKILIVIFAFAFLIAIGLFAFLNTTSIDQHGKQQLILSTSTPAEDLNSTGWWNSIPTDPALPSMPGNGDSVLTATSTPTASKIATSTAASIPEDE